MIRRAVLLGSMVLSACGAGELGEDRRLELDAGPNNPTDAAHGIDSEIDAGFLPDAAPIDTGPIALGGASVGESCLGGVSQGYVVFSVDPTECAAHGQAIEGRGPGGTIFAPLQAPTQFPASVRVDGTGCFSGTCAPLAVDLELSSYAVGTGAAGMYSLTLPDGTMRAGDLAASWCDYPAGNPPPATGLRITEVSIYQAVKIPIVQGGAPIGNRNAPIVTGRPGVIRVFVEIDPGFRARPIVARLELTRGGAPAEVLETQRLIERTSLDSNFISTLNFELTGDQIASDTRWTLTLYENDACTSEPGNSDGARMPTQGDLELGADSANGGLEIVLVPIRYNADGSGRLPDTSAAMVDRFRESIWKIYPVSELTITVHTPMDWGDSVNPNLSGWPELLTGLLALRSADQPPRGTYYYGLVVPNDTFEDYCPAECYAGQGPVPDVGDVQARGAVGLGYDRQGTFETFPHEIGRVHGRVHSGCMTDTTDPSYPYPDGQNGVWGYDIVTKGFKSPFIKDVMSYCRPSWISDYTYAGLFERIRAVNIAASIRPDDQTWRTAIFDANGLREGRPLFTNTPPRGRAVAAELIGAGEAHLGPVTAVRVPLADSEGALIWIAPQPPGTVAIELEGYGRLSIH